MGSMTCYGHEFWCDCWRMFYRMACVDIYNFLSHKQNRQKGLGILEYINKYVVDDQIKKRVKAKISNITYKQFKDKFNVIRNKSIAHWENDKKKHEVDDYWNNEFEIIAKTIGDILTIDLGLTDCLNIVKLQCDFNGIEDIIPRVER